MCVASRKAIKLEHPTVRRGSLDPVAVQWIFVGWNRRMPHGINIASFCDNGEVEEVFTSTTVRTRDTVFPSFGGAGFRSVIEAKVHEFGDMTRTDPEEPDRPRLALRR